MPTGEYGMLNLYSHEPFIGRKEEIATIHNAFLDGKRVVFITGYAGVGKSRLVKESVNIYKHEYYHIKTILSPDMLSYGEDPLRRAELSFIGDTNDKTLLIVDGPEYISESEGKEVFLQLLPSLVKNSNLNLIFITRRSGMEIPPHLTDEIRLLSLTVNLNNLSDSDAFALVNNLLTSFSGTTNANLYNRIRDISNGNPALLTFLYTLYWLEK